MTMKIQIGDYIHQPIYKLEYQCNAPSHNLLHRLDTPEIYDPNNKGYPAFTDDEKKFYLILHRNPKANLRKTDYISKWGVTPEAIDSLLQRKIVREDGRYGFNINIKNHYAKVNNYYE
ncbi:hypothetical protein ABEL47_01690 [Escherichia coli]